MEIRDLVPDHQLDQVGLHSLGAGVLESIHA